uniref:Uncharacterized protein n=1 Tax=Sphaerodactylus townsendi TaxID=933632 RepID=A0ACB8GCP8_9SAUR
MPPASRRTMARAADHPPFAKTKPAPQHVRTSQGSDLRRKQPLPCSERRRIFPLSSPGQPRWKLAKLKAAAVETAKLERRRSRPAVATPKGSEGFRAEQGCRRRPDRLDGKQLMLIRWAGQEPGSLEEAKLCYGRRFVVEAESPPWDRERWILLPAPV